MLNKKLKYSNMFHLKCKRFLDKFHFKPAYDFERMNLIDCGEPTYIA